MQIAQTLNNQHTVKLFFFAYLQDIDYNTLEVKFLSLYAVLFKETSINLIDSEAIALLIVS